MAFSYTTGNPTNITDASTASMNDIKNSFTDIASYVNGNLPGDSVSSAAFPWRTIAWGRGDCGATLLTTTPMALGHGGFFWSADGSTNNQPVQTWRFDPADHAMTGKTFKVRLLMAMAFNAVTGNYNIPFAVHNLSVANTGATSFQTTINSSICPITLTGDRASTNMIAVSSEENAPSAGSYGFGTTAAGTQAGKFCVTFIFQGRWT